MVNAEPDPVRQQEPVSLPRKEFNDEGMIMNSMRSTQESAQHKTVYLLIGIISLILSVICWILLTGTGPSLIDGQITFGEYIRRWWTFSVLAIQLFPLSVFVFLKLFSVKIRALKKGVALVAAVISVNICFFSGIMITGKIINQYAPERLYGNLEVLYVAVLVVCGLITGFCLATLANNTVSEDIPDNENDTPAAKDTYPSPAPGRPRKYEYLEEYKAKMKEGRQ